MSRRSQHMQTPAAYCKLWYMTAAPTDTGVVSWTARTSKYKYYKKLQNFTGWRGPWFSQSQACDLNHAQLSSSWVRIPRKSVGLVTISHSQNQNQLRLSAGPVQLSQLSSGGPDQAGLQADNLHCSYQASLNGWSLPFKRGFSGPFNRRKPPFREAPEALLTVSNQTGSHADWRSAGCRTRVQLPGVRLNLDSRLDSIKIRLKWMWEGKASNGYLHPVPEPLPTFLLSFGVAFCTARSSVKALSLVA